jgi:hypothetical protein
MSPRPVERLEKTLARVAKEQGLAQERLRRWVGECSVLATDQEDDEREE